MMTETGQDPSVSKSVIELPRLFEIVAHQDDYLWEYFRDGVDIHRLYGDGATGPNAALLRYRETSPIPTHIHEGYEHILVLCGCQEDTDGLIEAGTLRIHPPGTLHRGTGYAGCIVLAIYEKPVRFV
ncbi:MAG: cupin domain-containing protein [Verrucomicrobiota bacterium]